MVLMIALVHQKKKIRLTFVKQRQNFANDDESYFYVNKKE